MKWLSPFLLLSYFDSSFVMAGCVPNNLSFCFQTRCSGYWECRQTQDCSFGQCDPDCVSSGRSCYDLNEERCKSYVDCDWNTPSGPTPSPTPPPVTSPTPEQTVPTPSPNTSPTPGEEVACADAANRYEAAFADLNPSCECGREPDTGVEYLTCRDKGPCERCNNGVCAQYWESFFDHGGSWNQYRFNNDDGLLVFLYLISDNGTCERSDECILQIEEEECASCSISIGDNGERCMIADCFNTEYYRKYGRATIDTCTGEDDLRGPLQYFGNGIGESFDVGGRGCDSSGTTRGVWRHCLVFLLYIFVVLGGC